MLITKSKRHVAITTSEPIKRHTLERLVHQHMEAAPQWMMSGRRHPLQETYACACYPHATTTEAGLSGVEHHLRSGAHSTV